MLYIIGIGIGDAKDITLNGLEAVKNSDLVFLEGYTSIINCPKEKLESFYGKKITIADRNMVEGRSDEILEPAKKKAVSFLVVGDPFGATPHSDLFLRAKEKKIEVKIIHNASIMNAIGETGLELYKFGKATSIVFDDGWLPETPYDAIRENISRGLHTLCLLDIKVAEPSKENLRKGISKPEPARYMTASEAIGILRKIEAKRKEKIITDSTIIIGIARLGTESQKIIAGKLKDIEKKDFGGPLHSIIVPGKLHDMEKQMLHSYGL